MAENATAVLVPTQRKEARGRATTKPPEQMDDLTTPHRPRFGLLLRQYREELGLTQRLVADLLGVDTSTIARIEAGSRKPPRDAGFYRNLYDIPGLEEEHIRALLATEDVPQFVILDRNDSEPPPKPLPRVAIASTDGLQVVLTLSGETEGIPDEELDRILRSAKETTEVLLSRLNRRCARPNARPTAPVNLDRLAAEATPRILQHLQTSAVTTKAT